jgi:hypothetical protein
MQVGAQGRSAGRCCDIVRVVDEGAQVHPVPLPVAQQVVRAHLVALVGRVRQAVHQVQELPCRAAQPRLRTMNGPSQLASPMGMRRQVSISSLYLALDGLFCGTASRLYRQYS